MRVEGREVTVKSRGNVCFCDLLTSRSAISLNCTVSVASTANQLTNCMNIHSTQWFDYHVELSFSIACRSFLMKILVT